MINQKSMLGYEGEIIVREIDRKIEFLKSNCKTWLVTGVAGFIGSNILEYLLKHDQKVVGLDNFATGHRHNLEKVETIVSDQQWSRFRFIEGDICSLETCISSCEGVDHVLHQAALGSVPRSIEDPVLTNNVNIGGFLNVLVAARDSHVESFVYAASSSTYGDSPDLPKRENRIGESLSPYAVTKYVNELYASVFKKNYDFNSIGVRYFNIFGPRQGPNGAYAAVIPKWVASMVNGEKIHIFGNGDTSRDFCYVDNAVEANVLAALSTNDRANGEVFNVALDDQTSLNELFGFICDMIKNRIPDLEIAEPDYSDYRKGDVLHSRASIDKARELIGYDPQYRVQQGLEMAMDWYVNDLTKDNCEKV